MSIEIYPIITEDTKKNNDIRSAGERVMRLCLTIYTKTALIT